MPTLTEDPKRFKPAMPKIPGVPENSVQPPPPVAASKPSLASHLDSLNSSNARLGMALAAALAFGVAIGWWTLRASRKTLVADQNLASSAPALVVEKPQGPIVPPAGPAQIGTVQELAKPWASKRFFFRRRLTDESVPALVVHLPGGNTYWGFSLQAPFGRCELEFITDLRQLAKQYGYRANHPMVVDPCNATVYDPLRMGSIPSGAWARGEVVQGGGVRPPVGIDVRMKGDRLFASQIE